MLERRTPGRKRPTLFSVYLPQRLARAVEQEAGKHCMSGVEYIRQAVFNKVLAENIDLAKFDGDND